MFFLSRAAGRSLPTRSVVACFILGALSGCSIFSGKPALPQHPTIERGVAQRGGTDFAELVANAEIIYFPEERAASGARSEPAALLLEALRQKEAPFAIAWDLMDATQQPLLDELLGKPVREREELIARLELVGRGRAREHCRSVLRDARLARVAHLALRCPAATLARIETRERLTPEEEKQLPGGYSLPAGGFEVYAERLSASGSSSEPTRSYRALVAGQQFAAEKIVRYFRANGASGKLLVFLRASDLEAGQGVPHYVAQKIPVRQLVLDSSGSARTRPNLITRRD